jgi:hypothetical protein
MNYWPECLKTILGMPISLMRKESESDGKINKNNGDIGHPGNFYWATTSHLDAI